MIIKLICNNDELKRIDDIQNTMNPVMKSFAQLGFKGTITIEEVEMGTTAFAEFKEDKEDE